MFYCYIYRSQTTIATMWKDVDMQKGYFIREPRLPREKYAFTNFGISYGLQSLNLWPEKVNKLNNFFETYKSGDEYDMEAITHVMHLNSLLPGVLIKAYQPS